MKILRPSVLIVSTLVLFTGFCFGEDASFQYSYYEFSPFAGAGVTGPSPNFHGTLQFGASVGFQAPLLGILFEGGYNGPATKVKDGSALFSANYSAPCAIGKSKRFRIFGTTGYTRLFGSSNAINYGGGMDYSVNEMSALRFEVRDYMKFTDPLEHCVALRIGYVFLASPR
jgi:hypothetical protein